MSTALKNFMNLHLQIPSSSLESLMVLWNQIRTFQKGEHIVNQGDLCSDLYFLESGIARFYFTTPDGKEHSKAFHIDRQLVGSLRSLAQGTPSQFSIKAESECRCVAINYKKLIMIADKDIYICQFLRLYFEKIFLIKEQREMDFMTLSAAERYQKFKKELHQWEFAVPQYHIASYLGITPEALSRIRSGG